ncbi:hypothetical protein GCM10010435_92100 [Winogradskya consettensis]|uniref:GGDEF domain-containing protein n=1 Tax=Winogradskya consettensis TaxID=113560 RepID=A0A919SZH2_9ACTN|nr:diguanylate cyclase [Actinoplanes consettensis]GIM81336.1 hypothetical protein Aco04nite_76060 [Actinoplanes consettensis]
MPALDALTGCRTRAALDSLLPEALLHAAGTGTECSLFLLDLDYFKSVNDAYGHARGDEILSGVSERIRALLREQDLLFRYGGDELVVVLPGTARGEAGVIARRIVDGVGATPFPGQPPLTLTISLGVSTYPGEATDAAGLLAVADRRNYLAKHRGRAQAATDDAADAPGDTGESRLLERDAALTHAATFLSRVLNGSSGTLRVTGVPGVGHTRFLTEIAKLARLRGMSVLTDVPAFSAAPGGTLLLLDLADGAALQDAAALVSNATPGAPVALVRATTDPGADIELKPWSAAAVRTFLRTALRGEPSPQLVDWLDSRSGGLPALVTRELNRLVEQSALERTTGDGWTLTGAVQAGAERRSGTTGDHSDSTLAASLCRLPPHAPDFTGRDVELAVLVDAARTAGQGTAPTVASISGPPGVGKTSMAVHLAHVLAEDFPDGQWYLDLLGTDEHPMQPADALGRLLAALGVPAERIPPSVTERTALFRSLTRERRQVLILDNVSTESQVRPLLPASPTFLVFVTSRRGLAGLEGARRLALDTFTTPNAVDLLARITGRERVDAEPDAAAEVARLCGNLPLALRIAGNRLASRPTWSIDHLAKQLGNDQRRLAVLKAGDLQLTAIFSVSYRQLTAPAQVAFRRLGLIPGPDFDPVPAGLLLDEDPFDAEDLIGELVDAGLVEVAPAPGRYRFNDLLRLFAREVLTVAEGPEAVRGHEERLQTWLLAVAAQAAVHISPGDEDGPGPEAPHPLEPRWDSPATAIAWLDAEWGNWLGALRLSAHRPAAVLRLAWSMHWYSDVRWYQSEWREVFALGVDAARTLGDRGAECVLIDYLAWTYSVHQRIAEAEPLLVEALALAREVGNRTEEGWALLYLGNCALRSDRPDQARDWYEQAVALFTDIDFVTGLSIALSHLGEAHSAAGHLAEALDLQERSAGVAERGDHPVGLGLTASRSGRLLALLDRPEESADSFARALTAFDRAGAFFEAASLLEELAAVQLTLGRTDAAIASLETAARKFAETHDLSRQAATLQTLSRLRG